MNNQFRNKMVDNGTTPKFNMGMFFCVQTNTTSVVLKDCYRKELSQEQIELLTQTAKEDSVGTNFLKDHYKYEDQLIQRQGEIIKVLEGQISEKEQEIVERDEEIARLENDLEEVCEELFLEVNL